MSTCRLCSSVNLESLIDFGSQPILHHLMTSSHVDVKRYPFILSICKDCAFFHLEKPISPSILYQNYFTLSSWKHQPHCDALINLIELMCEPNSDTKFLEVGCNDGSFIEKLNKRGYKNILGIEPTQDSYCAAVNLGCTVLNDFFDSNLAKQITGAQNQFDILITRQVLEHIEQLDDFGRAMYLSVKEGGYLVIEVPAFSMNLNYSDYSLWEEHINYFTIETLRYYLSLHGFQVITHDISLFSGLALTVIAKKIGQHDVKEHHKSMLKKTFSHAVQYKENWHMFKRCLHQRLDEMKNNKIAVYGAGSRSCFFVNSFEISDWVECYVDDQKEKQNYFVPAPIGGRVLPIYESNKLYEKNIDFCFLGVNTECELKVINKHQNFVKEGGQFKSILPPSSRLFDVWNAFI